MPLCRVTNLVFATCFINLAVPSTAARVATSIRFFQRSGATPAGAVSAGALDSVFGFVAQITLLARSCCSGFGTLGPAASRRPMSTGRPWDLVIIVVAAGHRSRWSSSSVVPPLRQMVVEFVGQLREALDRAALARQRSSGCWASTSLAELLFSLTIWTVLRAFGQSVDFADVVIINEAVALFAGLIPVPGGVGVTEARPHRRVHRGRRPRGHRLLGAPSATGICTFYLPPIWGYLSFNSLQRDGYL